MIFNFKKIASVLASTAMIGSTIALAAAAAYPAPFVNGGNSDVAVVYGSNAYVDLVAVADITQSLQAELAKQTATSGASTGAVASGESINLATSSQRIYMNASINAARTVLTDVELPTILAKGTASDNAGTSYDYTQTVTLGDTQVTFGKSGESIDPVPQINVGSTAAAALYNYTLTLTKTLNVSDSSVIGNAEFKIQGMNYVVGANSDYNTLYLYGSGVAASVDEGETKTVTVADVDHTVTLKGASSTTAATIIVDGVQKSVTKGSSYKFAGNFEVYVKDVFYTTKTGTLSNADLLLGANTLHLESGQVVRKGSDDTSIAKTLGTITGTAGAGITAFTVQQASESSTGDYIAEGASFTDRVFGGLKVQFGGLVSKTNDPLRDTIVVDTDNAVAARVKMTTKVSGKEFSLPYARDVDGVSDSALKVIKTVNDGNKTIHLIEADPIATNDWVIVNAGDKGRILELTGIGAGTSTNDKTTFRDVITAEEFKFSTGTDNQSSLNIDGNTYYVKTTGSDTGSANITWGSSSNYGSAGAATTIFPRVQLKNGEWMSILKQVAVNASTIYALPGNFLLSTYEAGTNVTWTNQTTANSVKIGNINYTLTVSGNTTNANITGALIGTTVVNFNDTAGPAILIEEEKTLADSEGNEIVIPLTTEGTTTVMPAIGSVATTDGAIVSPAFSSLQSNNNKNQLIDIFGTWIERDTSNNNVVTVMYPDEQMYADVLFTAPSATVQAGSSGSGSVQELGSVKVTDSEVSSVSTKSLIVVGGSCVNGVAAKLLGSDAPVCGADFTAKTGVSSGQFLIQSFASPYSGTKVATLVAGYNLQDTLNAATYFRTNKPDTAVGKKFVGTTATSATLVSTTTTA